MAERAEPLGAQEQSWGSRGGVAGAWGCVTPQVHAMMLVRIGALFPSKHWPTRGRHGPQGGVQAASCKHPRAEEADEGCMSQPRSRGSRGSWRGCTACDSIFALCCQPPQVHCPLSACGWPHCHGKHLGGGSQSPIVQNTGVLYVAEHSCNPPECAASMVCLTEGWWADAINHMCPAKVEIMRQRGLRVDTDRTPGPVQADADQQAAAAPWKGVSWVPSKRAFRVRYGVKFAGYRPSLDAAVSLAMETFGWSKEQAWLGSGNPGDAADAASTTSTAVPSSGGSAFFSSSPGTPATPVLPSRGGSASFSPSPGSPVTPVLPSSGGSASFSPSPGAPATPVEAMQLCPPECDDIPVFGGSAAIAGGRVAVATPPRKSGSNLEVPRSWLAAPPGPVAGARRHMPPRAVLQDAVSQKVARFKALCHVYGPLCPGDLQDFIDRRQRAEPSQGSTTA